MKRFSLKVTIKINALNPLQYLMYRSDEIW